MSTGKTMAASSNKEEPEQLTQQIEDLSIEDNNIMLTTCANCGKEDLNVCNKCDLAAYCKAACDASSIQLHRC